MTLNQTSIRHFYLLATLICCVLLSCSNTEGSKGDIEPQVPEGIYSRGDFEQQFYSKPYHYVIKRLGSPDKSGYYGGLSMKSKLTYRRITFENSPDDLDGVVYLFFNENDAQVIDIQFY